MAIKFVKEDTTIGITRWPDRKKQCLYMMVGSVVEPLAYFQSDIKAAKFEKFFNRMIEEIAGPTIPQAGLPEEAP